MKPIKEDIKKINLAYPGNTTGTIYFTMEKTDVNEKVQRLNDIYKSVKNLNVSLLIPSKNNKKSLEVFKSKFPNFKTNITNEGLSIIIEGKDIID
jgi:hypothetical protein